MIAARNFSVARQCMRPSRVAPRFAAPIAQVPNHSDNSVVINAQLTKFRHFKQVRFYASPAQEAVAKFKGQKGPDVRFSPTRTRFSPLCRCQPRSPHRP